MLLRHPRRRLRLFAPCLFYFVVNRIVAEIGPTWIGAFNWVQQVVGQGHVDQAATEAGLNSSARNSRNGISSSSTSHTFWPNGTWYSEPSRCSQTVMRPRRTISSG